MLADIVADEHFQLIGRTYRTSDCGLLKQERRTSDSNLIAADQLSNLNRLAVDERSIRAFPVAHHEAAGRLVEADRGMCS